MKKGTFPIKSGLTFGEQIHTQSASESRDFIIIKYLLALAGTFGILMTAVSSFALPVNPVALFFKTAFFLGIFAVAAWKRNLAKFILPAFFLILLISFRLESKEIIIGFKETYNAVIGFAEELYENTPAKIPVEITSQAILDSCIEKSFTYLAAVLGFIMSTGILYSVNLFPVLTVTLPILAAELFIGLEPSAWAFVLVLCCWVSVLAMQISSYKVKVKNSSSAFIRERKHSNTFYPTYNFKNSVVSIVGIITAAVTLVSYAGIEYYLAKNDLNKEEKINEVRDETIEKLENISLENIVEKLTPDSGQDVTLGDIDVNSFKNITDLKVTLPYADHTVYLKGYVGGTYKDNGWTSVPDELYEKYSDIFKGDFIPQNMDYEFYSLAMPFNNPRKITVENVNADKRYVYAPYFTDYSSESYMKYVKDAYVSSKWKDKYSFSYYYNSKETDMLNLMYNGFENSNGLSQSKINEFSAKERRYREFVHEAYTVLPGDRFGEIKTEFGKMKDSSDWVYKLYSVRKYLSDYTYTLSPGRTPAGKDFVEHFLYENKKGYCTYFASSAVIMLRAAGVPARYVEGYVVRADDFSGRRGESETVEIKDSASHAWVEIYVDGAGWIPYEVTPPDSSAATEPEETTAEITTAPPVTEETAVPTSQPEPIITEQIPESDFQDNENTITMPPIVSEETPTEQKPPVSYSWILWAGAILLTLLIPVLRRSIVLKKRNRSFGTDNINQNIRNMYSYLESLMRFIGLENKDALPYTKYADYADKNLLSTVRKSTSDETNPFEIPFKTVMKISLAAGFGENPLSKEEEQAVYRFADTLCEEIYKELSPLKKLWFKFGLNLK